MHHDPRDSKCAECYKEFQAEREAESMAVVRSRNRGSDDPVVLEKLGIRGLMARMTFDSYEPTCPGEKAALEVCLAFAKNPAGNLVLLGNAGTGKTHLAVSICRVTGGTYTRLLPMLRNIRETYGREGDTEQRRIDRWAGKSVLALDEIGTQMGSLSEGVLAFEILDDRYILGNPTVIVSNGTREELEATLGLKVFDRLAQGGQVVVFDWESRRRKP